ncbi:MAG: FAD-dependent oxidoreductase [Planctomycetales bacterium]|nr:FAD-dependent oxidoreductase [Planctomycetales bacterium]
MFIIFAGPQHKHVLPLHVGVARFLIFVVLFLPHVACGAEQPPVFDVVVYGGTSGGVIAAVQAKRMGKRVVLVCPDKHLGGLTSGGLGWTDTGDKSVIGGLAREFYHRVWKKYNDEETWIWQHREGYGNKGQGTPAIDGDRKTMWIFEPHVAEAVFDDLIRDHQIEVRRDEWLDRETGVTKENQAITSIRTLSGNVYRGRIFIDATYEGDLMAAAEVSYHVGRESQHTYDEQWNGIQTGVLHHGHHFGAVPRNISPYQVPGDPASGLLARVSPDPPGDYGAGDHRIQAYCFRMCLTNHDPNRRPFPRPEEYDPAQYELLLRIYEAGWRETFAKFDPIPNFKTDTNNHGPFSTDNMGYNYDYPEASYARRQEIIREHTRYQQGLMYFIANDPRVPEDVQSKMRTWGLAKDEFVDNDNWPHQIYVREARRLIGRYVMTEHELLKRRPTPEPVGMGSYTMDSHNVQRYVTSEGYVQNEGDIGVSTHGPYQIAYGSLVPQKSEVTNLLVPVCVSSSHIAFGSIRMEPVFMILGQSAATAASMAIDEQLAVQDVDYGKLRVRLVADGQVLESDAARASSKGADPKDLPGTVVDDERAERRGHWVFSSSLPPFVGRGYHHDSDRRDGQSSVHFEARLPQSGMYEVRLAYSPHSNRATCVPVMIHHAEGTAAVTVNQRMQPAIEGQFVSLGTFRFEQKSPALVDIENKNVDGYVVVDAVQWLRAD